MADMTPIYRAGKRLVGLLPAWLIRFRPFVVYEISLTNSGDASPSPPAPQRDGRERLACRVQWVADAATAAALRPLASQECIEAWNGSTRRAVAAWLDGRPVACAWVAAGSFEERELGLHIELAPDEAWLFAAVVASEQRDRGVYRQLLEFLVGELRRNGLRRLLLGVTVGNEPSRRAHARQGAVEVGRIFALRLLGTAFSCCTGQVRSLPRRAGSDRPQTRFAVDP